MLRSKTPSSQPPSPTTTPQWRPLPRFPNLPPLLISAQFSANAYTIHLTDLGTIWIESLDKKGILKRSLTEDTSIDLMDADAEQWGVFLSKLGSAFDARSEEHAGTSLTLGGMEAAGRSFGSSLGSPGDGDLVLHITCVLPEPLEPLQWPVLLKKCPASATAERLTLPLLRERARAKRDVEDLVERLREKDVVVTKLVDKLEMMGAGLENVFHVLNGKRKTSRAVAEEKVKGLRAFGEGDWRRERAGEGDTGAGDVTEVMRKAFGVEGDSISESLIKVSSQLDDWWSSLGSEAVMAEKEDVIVARNASTDGKKIALPRDNSTKSSGQADDDDFQVQSTPPHLQAATAQKKRKTPKPPKPRWMRDESSDDSDDDDSSIPDSHPVPPAGKGTSQDQSASQSSRTVPIHDDETASSGSEGEARKPAAKAPPPPRKGLLGAIGRKQKVSAPGAAKLTEREVSPPVIRSKASPAPENNADDVAGDDDDLTASDSDSDTSMKGSKGKSTVSPALPKRAGLGRIGAKVKTTAPAQAQKSPPPALAEDEEQSEAPAKATKLYNHNKDTGEDAMDTDAIKSHENSPAPTVEEKPAASKPAGRKTLGTIGKIGGKKQIPPATSAPTTSAAGAKGGNEEAQDAAKKRARNDSATPTAISAPVSSRAQEGDEDDEHRAERKRAELARELEKKAAAPAKKKRRF